MYPTPGRKNNNDSLAEMPTPETPYGCTWYPNPDARTRKTFKRMIDSLPDDDRRPKKRKFELPGTPVEVYYEKIGKNMKEFLEKNPMPDLDDDDDRDQDTKPLCSKDADNTNITDKENENTLNNPEIQNDPLKDVVVFVSKKLSRVQKDIHDAVAELGGDYSWTYDNSVTHFIFQGKNNDISKDFRLARQDGKTIVAPEWVWMCRDEKSRIDEILFPHTHNPKLSLSITSSKPVTNKSRRTTRTKSIISEKDDSAEEGETDNNSKSDNSHTDEGSDKEVKKVSSKIEVSKQLEELRLAAASVTGEAESLSRRNSLSKSKSIADRSISTPTRQINPQPPPPCKYNLF